MTRPTTEQQESDALTLARLMSAIGRAEQNNREDGEMPKFNIVDAVHSVDMTNEYELHLCITLRGDWFSEVYGPLLALAYEFLFWQSPVMEYATPQFDGWWSVDARGQHGSVQLTLRIVVDSEIANWIDLRCLCGHCQNAVGPRTDTMTDMETNQIFCNIHCYGAWLEKHGLDEREQEVQADEREEFRALEADADRKAQDEMLEQEEIRGEYP
jgi:hypothetical protein